MLFLSYPTTFTVRLLVFTVFLRVERKEKAWVLYHDRHKKCRAISWLQRLVGAGAVCSNNFQALQVLKQHCSHLEVCGNIVDLFGRCLHIP